MKMSLEVSFCPFSSVTMLQAVRYLRSCACFHLRTLGLYFCFHFLYKAQGFAGFLYWLGSHAAHLHSPEVQKVGEIERDARGAAPAAAAATPAEPRGRDDVHRARDRALCQHCTCPPHVCYLTSTYSLSCQDPWKHWTGDRVRRIRQLEAGHSGVPAFHLKPPGRQADDSGGEVGKDTSR